MTRQCQLNSRVVDDRAVSILSAEFPDVKVKSTNDLVGGISARTVKAHVELASGAHTEVVVKEIADYCFELDADFAAHQFDLLLRLSAFGIKAPKPVAYGEATERFPTGYLILEYIEGTLDFSGAEPTYMARAYAEELAAIHRVPTDPIPYLLRQNLGRFKAREQSKPGTLIAAIAEALEQVELEPPNSLVLCHGDFWPGNVLWKDRQISGVIDWENALVGDPLFDLALSRLDLRIVAGAAVSATLADRYKEFTGAELSLLPYWDLRSCYRLIRGLESWPEVYPLVGRPDLTRPKQLQIIEEFALEAMSSLGK